MREAASTPFWNSQLQNSVTVPDYDQWEGRYRDLSARAAARHGTAERIATGADPMQAVWRTRTGRESHALVFIHGGYWRRFSAADFAFPAEAAAAANATFYNVDYRLMPAARMEDVVADTVLACLASMDEPDHFVIVGHSAGAHLAVEAALRLPHRPRAVVAISGLYELEPLRSAFIQEELELTPGEVAAFSPQDRAAEITTPLHLYAGAEETAEFRRQSARLYDAVNAAGGEAHLEFVADRHHSSVVADLAEAGSTLTQRVVELLKD